MKTKNKNLIGKGYLTWNRTERIIDRYGTVSLLGSLDDERFLDLQKFDGYGKLVVLVIKTRESRHIGDLSNGFFPEMPEVGELIVLGEGYLFYEENEYGQMVGLQPTDGRAYFWLEPKKLYRSHEQYVELYFELCEKK